MNTKLLTLILTGTFFAATMIPVNAIARYGGSMSGPTQQIRTQSGMQIRDQQRLRDGSCVNAPQKGATSGQKQGNIYGPGDGTGNSGVAPLDGTGYGAPSNTNVDKSGYKNMQKQGNTYGPGDGTGNSGVAPLDGTGYGASASANVDETGYKKAKKKGNTYGPGDGTGNSGDAPQDGTGYGAPANR